MLPELESTLKALKKIDVKIEKNIFDKDEIQKEIAEISDFPELLDDIHHKISTLQQANAHELAKILETVMDIYTTLGSCVNNIGLTQDLIRKSKAHLSKEKLSKTDN